jgi:hypothetical protein
VLGLPPFPRNTNPFPSRFAFILQDLNPNTKHAGGRILTPRD